MLLRDPVVRAWSHWSLARALHKEPLSFEDAIEAEPERMQQASDPALAETDGTTRYRRISYLARGDYAPQLTRWFDVVGRERVLVLVSEEVFADPIPEFRKAESAPGPAGVGVLRGDPTEVQQRRWGPRDGARDRGRPPRILRPEDRGRRRTAGAHPPVGALNAGGRERPKAAD